MSIDERIEALTHSVELLAQIHRDNEEKYERRFQRMEKQMQRLGSYIRTVAAFVLDHETRLRSLEGDQGDEDQHGE